MKHTQISSKSVVSVSDAAMDRARRALSIVVYSPAKTQQIAHAALMLPEVAVMAGRKRSVGSGNVARKVVAGA